jgi:cytochrome c biogenesis protein CcmG, thiol:disulfide interchange protein DsbE
MNKFIPLAILFVVIFLIAVATRNLSNKQTDNATNSQEISSSTNGDSADLQKEDGGSNINFTEVEIDLPDFSIPDLFEAGKTFSKKDLIGKYTIINVFASWCSTCRMEHDTLLRMQAEAVADLYGIAWRDIDKNTIKYLQQNGNPFSRVGADNKAIFSKITNTEAVPETWLINPKGKIVLRLKGNLQEFSVDEIKRYIRLN